ncbi:polyserase-related [Holotrichia oblita]|uniref:Polyserase-related n=1 Tax=Holotrichia oblita TaxID=644536 RepID=A0ACB9TXA1_HOLOL|nr:polyserase-related [Holotrichia oblita]
MQRTGTNEKRKRNVLTIEQKMEMLKQFEKFEKQEKATSADEHKNWRVFGGELAKNGPFPFQVSVRLTRKNTHHCGGSIIHYYWILSAGHCVEGKQATDIYVVTGSTEPAKSGYKYNVATIVLNENFIHMSEHNKPFILQNDVSLLKLRTPVKLIPGLVQIVPLESAVIGAGVKCIASGYGATSTSWKSSDRLMFVNVETIDIDMCKARLIHGAIVGDSNLCTYGGVGRAVCYGDSGGPLVTLDHKQIGLTSFVIPCAKGLPDAYVRISSFLGWIKAHVPLTTN